MKTYVPLLAMCLGSFGLAQAQTTTTTTTNSTYSTSPATTDTTYRSSSMTTDSSNMAPTTNSTNMAPTTNSSNSSMSNSNMNSAPTRTNESTTTTTTYNSGDASMNSSDAAPKSERSWGKQGKFGIYAGVNFSRFVNEPIPDGAYRAGWQAGLYGRTGGTIFGQLGVEYRTSTSNLVRSGTGQPSQTAGEIRGQIDQQFVAIPAYVGVRVGSALGLRIQVGAELSTMIINSSNQFGIGKDDVRRTLLNGLGGVGINLGPLTLDAVYNLGLQNVFDNNDTKRNMLAFNLGFRF
ncbi:PorT family protein [Spirosoma profusum]|nr:PorT family protein [Spirosoma profusum]